MNSALLLAEAMPGFSKELERLLAEEGMDQLIAQVAQIRIVDRCRCGDPNCATFYTEPPPNGAWGAGHRNISLTAKTGMLILDVVNDRICCVEVLDREDIRSVLDNVMP